VPEILSIDRKMSRQITFLPIWLTEPVNLGIGVLWHGAVELKYSRAHFRCFGFILNPKGFLVVCVRIYVLKDAAAF
jgi:hypothetical protein